MANRYWVGGTGNWSDNTNHWSDTSGGFPGAVLPTSSDDVFVNGSSGSGTITVNITASCKNLDFTGYGGTFTGNSSTNIYGDLILVSGMTYNYSPSITFLASSGTINITSAGKATSGNTVTFNGAATFKIIDTLTCGSLTISNGVFDANGQSVVINSTSTSFISGSFSGTSSFYNLTINGHPTAQASNTTLSSDLTVTNALTITGANTTVRHLLNSNTVGTQRTVTAASVTASYADFKDIAGAGAAWDLSASTGGSGDCGGNSGITFTTATTQHWVNANGGSWTTLANWTSRIPLPQDDVLFNCAFGASKEITIGKVRLGKNIDFTGATWTTSLTATFLFISTVNICIFGSLTLISGLTIGTDDGSFIVLEGRSSHTLDTKGVNLNKKVTLSAIGGTYTLAGNFTSSGKALAINRGTFSAVNGGSNYVISVGSITSSGGTPTPTLTLGSGTHLLTATSSSVFIRNTLIITPFTGTLKITDTGNNNLTFAGGSATYNNIWFSRGTSTGSNIISESATFADLKDDGSVAHSITFGSGTTTTVSTFTVSGTAGNLITINTSSGTSTHGLVKTGSGTISCDYLNIQHSIASPSNTWLAGLNSVNNQATATAGSGWIFSNVVPSSGMMAFFD